MKEIILLLSCLGYTNHCQDLKMPSKIVLYNYDEIVQCLKEADRINDAGGSAICYNLSPHEGIEWFH